MILSATGPDGSSRSDSRDYAVGPGPTRRRRAILPSLEAGAVLSLVTAACGASSGSGATSGSHTPYTIAAILDLTGPTAASDAFQLQGIKIAISQVNAAGGIHGHKLVLKTADDGANPAEDGPAYQRLVEQGHAI